MDPENGENLLGKLLNHEELRPVPYWFFGLSSSEEGIAKRLDDFFGNRDWRCGLNEALEGIHVGFVKESFGDGTAIDTFGVLLEEGNITHVLRHPISKPSLDGFEWPNPEKVIDWEAVKRHYDQFGDRIRLCGFAMGLFERSWFLRGFENIMMDMVVNPGFVEDLLDGILEVHLGVMELITERIPIDAYFGGDDVSDQRGIMMGIKRWRQFFKPRLGKLISHSHSLGYPYILHACGNVMPLIDDFLEIGLDGLESLQSEANDVFEIKRKARDKLLLIGGMGVQSTLYHGPPEAVRRDARKLIDQLGDGGGYIIAPSKPLDPEPIENVVAFIDAITNQ
jgi:uroporphyrinogen decarboxylase